MIEENGSDQVDGATDDSDKSDILSHAMPEIKVKKAWDHFGSNDDLLFSSPKTDIDISLLHPPAAQIFKLWQIYLDNINPLLNVTHSPTLQIQIIDGASDIASTYLPLQALMFSTYCVAVHSLDEEECYRVFGISRTPLLTKYQHACQHTLQRASFLRSSDHDCLTALFLYLVSRACCPLERLF